MVADVMTLTNVNVHNLLYCWC